MTESYTVNEFKKKYWDGGKGQFSFQGHVITNDEIICDICNKEILQPKESIDKKVVFIDGGYALCDSCYSDANRDKNIVRTENLANTLRRMGNTVDSVDFNFMKAMEDVVYDDLSEGLLSGNYVFEDGDMTIEKWSKLSNDEKEKYPVGLKDKNNAGEGVLNFVNKLRKGDFNNALFKSISVSNDGMINIELTSLGIKMKKYWVDSGQDFDVYVMNLVMNGVAKEFNSNFLCIGKIERGNQKFGIVLVG